MNAENHKKILARTNAQEFVGRTAEFEKLQRYSESFSENQGMLLLAPPAAGVSEILRQLYDSLFCSQKIIPFYFSFSRNDQGARDAAARFLQTFLWQTIAFRRAEQSLLDVSLDVCEINELAAPVDAHWIHQLTKICNRESELNDEQSFIRQALSAPLRAAANNAPVMVLLDDLQRAPIEILEHLREIYQSAKIPFVFAGQRRLLFKAMLGGKKNLNAVEILKLDFLPVADAELLTDKLAKEFEVELSDSTRDLIVQKFNARPKFIEAILTAARAANKDLKTFQAFSQLYVDELAGGRIGKFYDDIFSQIIADAPTRKKIISLLYECSKSPALKIPAENWRENLALAENVFSQIIERLHTEEIINLNSGTIYFSAQNEVLNDYLKLNFRLENSDEPRALVVTEILKSSLERAPQLMSQTYRQNSIIGLNKILTAFNCQRIPQSLIDYEEFEKSRQAIEESPQIELPQIIFTATGASFYPPIAQATEEKRVAVALGFKSTDFRRENEIVWITAEIESKLAADKELTEFWCDRLEALAIICNFTQYQLWLVAPEGFAPEAIDVLKQRRAYGSSRRQLELLSEYLEVRLNSSEKDSYSEYEMVLPMSENVELIAAGAVEEIAKKHHFTAKDITKIKTALVEAYINAIEHSHSPDGRIYQKLTVDKEKIVITISNRGVKLSPEKFAAGATPIEPENGRRGWGLKLMHTLMDEVKLEHIDDGTQISLIKYKTDNNL